MKKLLLLTLGILIFAFAQAQDSTAVSQKDNGSSVDSVKIKIGDQNITIISKEDKLQNGLNNLQKGLDDFNSKINEKRQEIEIWTDSIKRLSVYIKQNGDNSSYKIVIDSLNDLIDADEDIVDALTDGIDEINESIKSISKQLYNLKKKNNNNNNYEYSYNDNNNSDNEDYNTKKHGHRRKSFTGHWASVDFGLNSYTTKNYSLNLPAESDFMSVNLIQSREFSINPLQYSIPFFNKYFGAVVGLGFSFNNYELLQNVKLSVNSQGSLTSELDTDITYKKNRFKTINLTAPLLIEIQIPVNKADDRIFISAGVIGSLNLNSKMKYVYYYKNTKIKYKDKSALWPVNQWNYAATVRVGVNKTYFYANYNLMPLFIAGKGPEIYPVSAGIGFSF